MSSQNIKPGNLLILRVVRNEGTSDGDLFPFAIQKRSHFALFASRGFLTFPFSAYFSLLAHFHSIR